MHAIRVVCPLSHLGIVAAENVVTLLKEGVHELFPDALPCAFSDTYAVAPRCYALRMKWVCSLDNTAHICWCVTTYLICGRETAQTHAGLD